MHRLVKPYHQMGGHNRTPGNTAVSGGKPWFDPTSFANPVEPKYTTDAVALRHRCCRLSATPSRNEFRGPGLTYINASIFRSFHVYRESAFQIRFEAFNVLNHPILTNPNRPSVAARSAISPPLAPLLRPLRACCSSPGASTSRSSSIAVEQPHRPPPRKLRKHPELPVFSQEAGTGGYFFRSAVHRPIARPSTFIRPFAESPSTHPSNVAVTAPGCSGHVPLTLSST